MDQEKVKRQLHEGIVNSFIGFFSFPIINFFYIIVYIIFFLFSSVLLVGGVLNYLPFCH
jgi:hypothetical protein